MVKGQGHWERNVEIVFWHIYSSKWIDLRHTKTKLIIGPFYTHIVEYISPAKMIRFL